MQSFVDFKFLDLVNGVATSKSDDEIDSFLVLDNSYEWLSFLMMVVNSQIKRTNGKNKFTSRICHIKLLVACLTKKIAITAN